MGEVPLYRYRKEDNFKVRFFLAESQGQKLALPVLHVPCSLESGVIPWNTSHFRGGDARCRKEEREGERETARARARARERERQSEKSGLLPQAHYNLAPWQFHLRHVGSCPLSNELGTNRTVTARFWPRP